MNSDILDRLIVGLAPLVICALQVVNDERPMANNNLCRDQTHQDLAGRAFAWTQFAGLPYE